LLFATLVETAFIVLLPVFLLKQADPMGEGMEMVGVSVAFMFIFLPFTLPALILAKERRHLVVAAFLLPVLPPFFILLCGSKRSTSFTSSLLRGLELMLRRRAPPRRPRAPLP
jgi:hypothetical protein